MKFFTAPYGKIKNGPGGKNLGIVLSKTEVTEQEFTRIINEFIDGSEAPAEKKEEVRDRIWKYLQSGHDVALGDINLTIQK